MLEQLLAEMAGEYPALGEVFVDERDIFLTHSLQAAANGKLHPKSNLTPTFVLPPLSNNYILFHSVWSEPQRTVASGRGGWNWPRRRYNQIMVGRPALVFTQYFGDTETDANFENSQGIIQNLASDLGRIHSV